MKIYTKRGDKGETSLIGGTRVSKYSLRIESYGTVDELNAYCGLIRDTVGEQEIIDQILAIQDCLFTIGSNLAEDPDKSRMNLPSIHSYDIEFLEKKIDRMDSQLEPLRKFILPGGHVVVSYCHIARCVCRRAERIVIGLASESEVDNNIIKFLNRLSDYFFQLSRYMALKLGAVEHPWEAKVDE